MTSIRKLMGRSVVLCAAIGIAAGGSAAADDEWVFKWSNGFQLESADGQYKLKFGGRIQADWTFVSPDNGIEEFLGREINDGNEFRRARVFFEGIIYERVEFKAQYDFAGGDADFKDVFVGVKKTPVGNIRFGHFKEPYSIEELTSSKYIAFLERSLPNVFAPGRNTGLMFHGNEGDRLTWAAGAFRETDDSGITDNGEGKVNLTARVTGLPVYESKGANLVHVGLSATQKDLGKDPFRFRQRPEAHQTERFVDTGMFTADEAMIYGGEAAVVWNRFWASAELMMADAKNAMPVFVEELDFEDTDADGTLEPIKVTELETECASSCSSGDSLGDPGFTAHTVQAGIFLTDDRRRFKTSTGTFDRQKPSENFGNGGLGAWEIAARYSSLDLTDSGIAGGELDTITLAVNWYLNPATRFMLNYVNADRDDVPDGGASYVLLRWQVDF